jgi:uncharacterized membrane protein
MTKNKFQVGDTVKDKFGQKWVVRNMWPEFNKGKATWVYEGNYNGLILTAKEDTLTKVVK